MQKRKFRWFLWSFVTVQAIFVIWIITAIATAHHDAGQNCQYLTQQECSNAAATGGAIAVGVIIGLWAFVDVILGVGRWVYVSTRRRPEPPYPGFYNPLAQEPEPPQQWKRGEEPPLQGGS